MYQTGFYATGQDFRTFLSFVFDLGCSVIPAYSLTVEAPFFNSIEEFESWFKISNWMKVKALDQLCIRKANSKGKVITTCRTFDDEVAKQIGASKRFEVKGLGFLNFVSGQIRNDGDLWPTSISAIHAKRAKVIASEFNFGDPSEWDWGSIKDLQRRIDNFLSKESITRKNRLFVLQQAGNFLIEQDEL